MSRLIALFSAAVAWQSRAVLLRHFRVYLQNWYTAFLPPATEPIVMLLAFGFGLGAHVTGLGTGEGGDYASYIAPGMIAYTAFLTPFFQSLFGAFIRMHYQRTWDGQLTTQIELPHVIWGELFWAALLGTIYAGIVMLVISVFTSFGVLHLNLVWLPVLLPLVFLFAIAFAALSLIFTSMLPTIDHMNLPVFLLALPMGFASNTYFPVPETHPAVVMLMHCNPLYHLAEGIRALLLEGGRGAVGHLLSGLGLCAVLVCILVPLTARKLRRRVLGDQ